jgi:hypothetical protein
MEKTEKYTKNNANAFSTFKNEGGKISNICKDRITLMPKTERLHQKRKLQANVFDEYGCKTL